MTQKMKHWDVTFAWLGSSAGISLAFINTVLGAIAFSLTIVLTALRIRREWRNRNRPPPEDE